MATSDILLIAALFAIGAFVAWQSAGAGREQDKQRKTKPLSEVDIEIYMPPEAMWACDDCGKQGEISADTTKEQALAIHTKASPTCDGYRFWMAKR